jgi:hypothetical protein
MASGPPYTDILADFQSYDAFMKAEKALKVDRMSVDPIRKAAAELTCKVASGATRMEIWVAWDRREKYTLQIFAFQFGAGRPCFRLDTYGEAHMNEDDGTGLRPRKVPTPHFHRVAESDGYLIAYQTTDLTSPGAKESIRKDIQFGTNLFCQESRVVSKSGGTVTVQIIPDDLDVSTDDPLGGTHFP